MSDFLAVVAAALDAPPEIVQRSAEARAQADGTTAEAVLAGWAGGEAPAAAAPAPEPAPAEEPETEVAPAPEPEAAAEPAEEVAPVVMADVPIISASGEVDWKVAAVGAEMPENLLKRSVEAKVTASGQTAAEIVREMVGSDTVPMPVEDAPDEAGERAAPAAKATRPADDGLESEEEAALAGAIPRWLVAAFILIPTVAVLYALFLPNGPNCGDAGNLAIHPISGVAVNCDLTPYGVDVVDFYAVGQAEYTACAACHGENGGGAGNFPAFVGGSLLEAFPEGQCQAQVDWVAVGTNGWPDATYGANAKPVGGSGAVMPAFGSTMTDDELRAVVLYERVRFGGQDLDAALVDCGLSEPEEGGE